MLVSRLSYRWFESVAQLSVSARAKLESAGCVFEFEEMPPFSTDARPMSSSGLRLKDGSEFWLVATESWEDGEFDPARSHDPEMKVDVRASPEQFGVPTEAVDALRRALVLSADEVEWTLDSWPEDVCFERERRQARE